MYDRILVPLDGSPLAEQVMPFVARISLGTGIPVHLMRVYPTVSDELTNPVHGLNKGGIMAGVHDEIIDYLNCVRRNTDGLGTDVTCEAYEGDAVSHIIEEAEKTPNSLVAMSTHGRSGVSRWLMGSVTDKVLHATKNPMLIVRGRHEGEPELDTNLETIIVPVDGSSLAEMVIPHVAALAKAMNLSVTLLRVATTAEEIITVTGYQGSNGGRNIEFQDFEKMATEARNQALDYLVKLEGSLREQGVAKVNHRMESGPPAQVIVDVAHDTSDNLVAMTTHGRSGPARWTLGSVADRVVRHSGDPVLVIRSG
ncbi:MAG: universal stress protein [SAR202 cluster bacterium]|nr:universal stress protein [SAR202 cluster bacterium]